MYGVQRHATRRMAAPLAGMLNTPSICEAALMEILPAAISTAGWQVLRASPAL